MEAMEAIVDTGATGDFRTSSPQPIPVYNVDRTLNEAGSIREVVNMIMTYDQHSECILLTVTRWWVPHQSSRVFSQLAYVSRVYE